MNEAPVRLFLGADPDAPARDAMARMQVLLRAALTSGLKPRWTAAADLHLTLRYFGAASPLQRTGIESLAARIAARHRPRSLPFARLAAWPASRPRLLVAEYRMDPELAALAAELEAGARTLGFTAETRPLRPHVTLGRLRTWRPMPALPAPAAAAPFPVAALNLYDRAPDRESGRYRILRSWPLAGE